MVQSCATGRDGAIGSVATIEECTPSGVSATDLRCPLPPVFEDHALRGSAEKDVVVEEEPVDVGQSDGLGKVGSRGLRTGAHPQHRTRTVESEPGVSLGVEQGRCGNSREGEEK